MLFLVAAWLLLLALAVPVGLAILRWIDAGEAFDRRGDRLVLAAWLGVAALGSGLLAVSFAVALSPAVGIALGGAAAGASLASSGVRTEIRALRPLLTPRRLAAALVLVAGVAIATTQPVVWIDTGIYHASAIRWLSEFGAVEGIGLVHERLGFASSWFALAAPFNPDGLRGHAAAVMGGFALLLLVLHLTVCAWRALQRRARPADWMIIAGSTLLIPASALSQKVHVSPSPDLPVNALTLLGGMAILSLAQSARAGEAVDRRLSPGPTAVPLLLALGAMAIKPHAAPLVIVATLFYLFAGPGWLSRAAWAVGLGTILIGPWIAYEFVTTGCPAFPVGICADVPWSVGGEVAAEATEAVGNARWETFYPGEGLSWVEPWLTDDLSPWLVSVGLGGALLAGCGLLAGRAAATGSTLRRVAPWFALAGAAALFVFLLRAEELAMIAVALASLFSIGNPSPASRWLLVLGVGGIAVLVYAAPDPRFGFGYIAVLIGRFAVFPPRPIWPRIRPYLLPPTRLPRLRLASLLALAAALAAVAPIARPTTSRGEVAESFGLLLPPGTPEPAIASAETNGIDYSVPADGFCWTAELPCAPDGVDPAVVLRDPEEGIGAGLERQ
jgi:hypothetical protein